MKFLLVLLPFTLIAACTPQIAVPQPTALDLPNDPRFIVRNDPTPMSLPGDCAGSDLLIDNASPAQALVSRQQAESKAGGMGDQRPADSAVLGRVTMPRPDFNGNPVRARPAWVLYWSGLTHRLLGGIPAKLDAPPTTQPVFYSTASVMVIDASTGEDLWGMNCGIVRVS
jgi:hypothetical protein